MGSLQIRQPPIVDPSITFMIMEMYDAHAYIAANGIF